MQKRRRNGAQTVTITTKRQATRRGEENMADCEATNEDFRHLDDGLPADIARLKAPSSRHACEPSVPACCAHRSTFA